MLDALASADHGALSSVHRTELVSIARQVLADSHALPSATCDVMCSDDCGVLVQ